MLNITCIIEGIDFKFMDDDDNFNLAEIYCKQARYILEEFFAESQQGSNIQVPTNSRKQDSKTRAGSLNVDTKLKNKTSDRGNNKNSNVDFANVLAEAAELYFKAINSFNKLAEPYLGLAAIFNFCQKHDLAIHFLRVGMVNAPGNKMIIQMLETITGSKEINSDSSANLFNFNIKKINNSNIEEV